MRSSRASDARTAARPSASPRVARLSASPRASWPAIAPLIGLCVGVSLTGCDGCSDEAAPPDPNNLRAGGLTAEQAGQVLARVGDRSITLGHYAAALERMDPLERIRYQTADRRQQLLDEMINVELLALEAERRGLDQKPETVQLVREYQRDELLRRLRAAVPPPADLSVAEVSEYYREHREEFSVPERRRAAHIVMSDLARARRVLVEARAATPERWRELVVQHSEAGEPTAAGDKTSARPPLNVPGDLGMLEAPGGSADADPVSEALRHAVFRIPEPGQVYPELITVDGKHHVVRLITKIEARQRTLSEVEDAIRARIVEERQAEARSALIARLREATRVSIDEAALERVAAPGSSTSAKDAAPAL